MKAQSELLSIVADKSNQGEEDFFSGIEDKLHNLCEEIASQVDADSAAVFFATEDNPPGSTPFMVMRGAWGRLKYTFDERVKDWRAWRRRACGADSYLFGADDLKDLDRLAGHLKKGSGALSQYLRDQFAPDTEKLLTEYDGSSQVSQELKRALAIELNRHLQGSYLYDEQRFAQISLRKDTQVWIRTKPKGQELIRLNRLLLEEAYPRELAQTHYPPLSGFAYPSKLTHEFLALKAEERQQAIKGWSVTNQIWHLAQGRIANSNRAMDELHGGHARAGLGDTIAYPGRNLCTTFRTMIGVPIFAQGGSVQTVQPRRDEATEAVYPSSASPRSEFLYRYRVIGILKVEGKQPLYDAIPDTKVLRSWLTECLGNKEEKHGAKLSETEEQPIVEWYKAVCETTRSLKAAYEEKGVKFPTLLQSTRKNDEANQRATLLRKGVVDALSRCCHAEFTRQDIELLVLLAMQVGRVMTYRVIKHAADNDIIISENEVGLLTVRWRDINHLVALRTASKAATRKVKFHLEALKAELDFKQRQEVYRTRISELLDPKGPIREVSGRTKEFISLTRKLVVKQRHLEENPQNWEIVFTCLKGKLEGYDHRSGERFNARGSAQLLLHRAEIGRGLADITVKLGTEGAPQLTADERNQVVALSPCDNPYDPDLPLVRRILDPDIYRVDDLTGARVIANYDSHVDEVLDELRARAGEWGMELRKVDDLREGKQGGYRAIHVTLCIDVKDLIPHNDVQILREALGLPEDQPLRMPVEVQLRTAYQHSWATKVHDVLYKREEQVAQDLRDEQEILSNVLAEADWLSDIVRGGIQNMLLPPDYGERKLLEHLKRRVHPGDLNVIRFGIACAKEILKNRLRYNGQPEFSFVMEICDCLVQKFGVTDSAILLLALLHNVWRTEHGKADPPGLTSESQSARDERGDDIVSQLCEKLEQSCHPVLGSYCSRLPLSLEQQRDSDWLRIWIRQFPVWFWTMQRSFRDYYRQPPEDIAAQWNTRLANTYYHLKRRHQEGHWREGLDDWLERVYMLEAAILLASLSDLPDEPGTARRKRLHNDYLFLFREIRKYLPNGPTKARVVEELDRAFREIETQLDIPREPEWWGE